MDTLKIGKLEKVCQDLVKTFKDGHQIVCECGTEEGYWGGRSVELASLKPIQDYEKCCSEMNNLIEIILASNRSIPSVRPNIK